MVVLFFVLGLVVGSFLNSLIYRLEKKESIVKKRSYCPFCKKSLSWFELIPLMSFIFQKGKCRKCKKKISLQYPLVELVTGIIFVLIGIYFFDPTVLSIINTCYLLVVICSLIIIFVYDLKHYIIPNEVIYSIIIVSFLYIFYSLFIIHNSSFYYNILSAVIAGLFFLIIVLFSRGKWMGMGDAKLALFMGLILGWPDILMALFIAFLIGAIVSIILIIFKKKKFQSEIPFGPFLSLATIITIFWGNILIDWYLGLFI